MKNKTKQHIWLDKQFDSLLAFNKYVNKLGYTIQHMVDNDVVGDAYDVTLYRDATIDDDYRMIDGLLHISQDGVRAEFLGKPEPR